jgi:predicted nuclease of predicted toxin-antitoxin system
MLKILTDVGVGKAVEEYLEQLGHDVLPVRELDPQMPDSYILDLAVQEQRLVITMDKGFGELVYQSSQPHAGVLLLRLEDARSDEKVVVVQEIFLQHTADLPNHFSVYQNGRLRIRP